MRYGFYFDADQCIGCKTCVMACKDIKNLPSGVSYRRVYNIVSGTWQEDACGTPVAAGVYSYSVSIACNHCKEPVCVAACPQKAIQKEADGIVWIDSEKCVGCRLCAGKCPHGAIQFNRKAGVSEKCDLCRELVKRRKEPACVTACPMRCLKLVDLDTCPVPEEHRTITYPVGSVTQPSTLLHLNRRTDPEQEKGEASVSNMPEEL